MKADKAVAEALRNWRGVQIGGSLFKVKSGAGAEGGKVKGLENVAWFGIGMRGMEFLVEKILRALGIGKNVADDGGGEGGRRGCAAGVAHIGINCWDMALG